MVSTAVTFEQFFYCTSIFKSCGPTLSVEPNTPSCTSIHSFREGWGGLMAFRSVIILSSCVRACTMIPTVVPLIAFGSVVYAVYVSATTATTTSFNTTSSTTAWSKVMFSCICCIIVSRSGSVPLAALVCWIGAGVIF